MYSQPFSLRSFPPRLDTFLASWVGPWTYSLSLWALRAGSLIFHLLRLWSFLCMPPDPASLLHSNSCPSAATQLPVPCSLPAPPPGCPLPTCPWRKALWERQNSSAPSPPVVPGSAPLQCHLLLSQCSRTFGFRSSTPEPWDYNPLVPLLNFKGTQGIQEYHQPGPMKKRYILIKQINIKQNQNK